MFPNTFTISSQPYYDPYLQCYKNIITLNIFPNGPLRQLTRQIKLNRLSPYQVEGPCNPIQKCALALVSLQNCNNKNGCNLMTPMKYQIYLHFLLEMDIKLKHN